MPQGSWPRHVEVFVANHLAWEREQRSLLAGSTLPYVQPSDAVPGIIFSLGWDIKKTDLGSELCEIVPARKLIRVHTEFRSKLGSPYAVQNVLNSLLAEQLAGIVLRGGRPASSPLERVEARVWAWLLLAPRELIEDCRKTDGDLNDVAGLLCVSHTLVEHAVRLYLE